MYGFVKGGWTSTLVGFSSANTIFTVMDHVIIALASLGASALTLFSGFGLGTLLMPVFALFFPLDLAIALTAIVHFLNNIFKLALLGRHTDRGVLVRFGLPAIAASFVGAALLVALDDLAPLATWSAFGTSHDVHAVALVIAVVMIVFSLLELSTRLEHLHVDRRHLVAGGLLSGFFGGLSGHQGALRSAFLVHANLSKEAFIATGVTIACLVDVSRLGIYARHVTSDALAPNLSLLVTATLAAFAGAYVGSRLMKKVTMRTVQRLVAVMLVVIALLLGSGVI